MSVTAIRTHTFLCRQKDKQTFSIKQQHQTYQKLLDRTKPKTNNNCRTNLAQNKWTTFCAGNDQNIRYFSCGRDQRLPQFFIMNAARFPKFARGSLRAWECAWQGVHVHVNTRALTHTPRSLVHNTHPRLHIYSGGLIPNSLGVGMSGTGNEQCPRDSDPYVGGA